MYKTQQFEFVALHKIKVLHRKKVLKQIVESLHLSTMAISYHLQFANYKMGKKQVIQLIPIFMWNQVYVYYQSNLP